ncbi:MAG: IPExxxVDY family protein [Bacteroidales bacterium]
MKSTRKITRIHLSVNDQDEPLIFGIVTSDPDYKLTLKLNTKLRISLKGSTHVRIRENEGKELVFSKFTDDKAAPDSVYHLFSNRTGNSFLIKSLKNIDYILLILDSGKNSSFEKIAGSLREIDTVTAVFNIEYKTLKDKNLKYLMG